MSTLDIARATERAEGAWGIAVCKNFQLINYSYSMVATLTVNALPIKCSLLSPDNAGKAKDIETVCSL